MQRSRRSAAYWISHYVLLRLPSYRTWTSSQELVQFKMGWVLPHPSLQLDPTEAFS